jgi:hypothetical protein
MEHTQMTNQELEALFPVTHVRTERDANRALALARDNKGRFVSPSAPQGLQPWLYFNEQRSAL